MKSNNKFFPLISVVIATYNGERFLRQQIDSITNQTYPNIEIIATDDCSTDATINILEEYQKKKILTYFKQKKNLGLTKNFEFGFKKAKGDFIAPTDQDDIWKKEKLEILYNNLDDRLAIFSDSEIMLENGKILPQLLSKGNLNLEVDSCLQSIYTAKVPGHSILIHKKLILQMLPFPAKMIYDHWIVFFCGLNKGIKYFPQPLVKYRQHSANVFGTHYTGKKNKKKKQPKEKQIANSICKLEKMYHVVSLSDNKEKHIIKILLDSYKKNHFINRLRRTLIVFSNRHTILKHKNYGDFRKILFSVKVFFKLVEL